MSLKEFLTENENLTECSFGEFVRQRRKELGFTLQNLATKFEISYVYMEAIEKGERNVPVKLLNQMVEILKINDDEKEDFLDLAYQSRGTCAPDLIEFLIANKTARNELRMKMKIKKNPIKAINRQSTFNPQNYAFHKYIRNRRENLGISLRSVAKSLNLSAPFLCEVEFGYKPLPIQHAVKLSQLLQIPEEEKNDFLDFASLSYSQCAPDLTDYMLQSRDARLAIRYLIENNISGSELLDFVQKNQKNIEK
jgi:transcriptional regulator with XRE-family HTH domain